MIQRIETPRSSRSGFTLVEMMVTMLVMLIMVLAMSQMFALVGRHVSDGRALIELQGQLRTAAYRIQEDLDGLTVRTRHGPAEEQYTGVLEYIEGMDADGAHSPDYTVGSDREPWFVNAAGTGFRPPTDGSRTAYGDIDDVLIFTIRSTGKPFVGRISGALVGGTGSVAIESHDAEVIYWTDWNDVDADNEIDLGEVVLRRRVLLIRPDLTQFLHSNPTMRSLPPNMPVYPALTPNDLRAFYNQNDLSVRVILASGQVSLQTNSLPDLARRENRVAHLPPTNRITPAMFPLNQQSRFPYSFSRLWLPRHFGAREGEDVVQSDLLAFDVRAWDPTADLYQGGAAGSPLGDLLTPGDWGWDAAVNPVGEGAFVDLAYLRGYASPPTNRGSAFSDLPDPRSGLRPTSAWPSRPLVPTYDTWTWFYEHDGVNQDNDGVTDEATNGIDDTGANGVDDPGEWETSPPYLAPLRGVRITLRVIELDTRQVRQTSVVADFVPE